LSRCAEPVKALSVAPPRPTDAPSPAPWDASTRITNNQPKQPLNPVNMNQTFQ
jgi:hypothetical protein